MQRLPYDVLHHVIEFVDWLPTLIALTLVSREVKLEVEPILWRYLNIRFDDERSMKKCAVLHGNDRGRHVRQLRISYVHFVMAMRDDSLAYRAHAMGAALQATANFLESTPNVETLYLIGAGLSNSEMYRLFTVLSRPECLPRVRVAFIDHAVCDRPHFIIDRMWHSHPTLVATHVRQQHRFPFERQPMLRPVPTEFLGECPQCPPSGTATRDGTQVPSFTIDDFTGIGELTLALSLLRLSTPPEYACFGHWALLSAMTPVLQGLPALRTLHITTSGQEDSSQQIVSVLDPISCLSKLEELIWSKGATIPAQEEVFARYKTGKLPSSLKRLVFTWDEGQRNNSRTYERKNLDDVKWSLISDDSRRPSRKVGTLVVPLMIKRHAEL